MIKTRRGEDLDLKKNLGLGCKDPQEQTSSALETEVQAQSQGRLVDYAGLEEEQGRRKNEENEKRRQNERTLLRSSSWKPTRTSNWHEHEMVN